MIASLPFASALLLGVILSTRLLAQPAQIASDIEYGIADGVSLKLDYSIPAGPGPFPTCILVHGGGWHTGDKKNNCKPLFAPLNDRGYAWFSINYRLAPEHHYPASVEDTETAIRWVRARAEDYRVDLDRLILCGESAGGHLVALVSTRSQPGCEVSAVIPFYCRANFMVPPGEKIQSNVAGYLGATIADEQSIPLLLEASPISHVHVGMPPFLLLHGTADQIVDYQQSVKFQEALRGVGVPCDLITIEGGGHGMVSWDNKNLLYRDALFAWLDAHFNP